MKVATKAALRRKVTSTRIDKIRDDQGINHSTNQDIAAHFKDYYTSLYNLPQHTTPPVAAETEQFLETPLSAEELASALNQMKSGKSPDPDGLTTQYFKSFSDKILPFFLQAFNAVGSTPNHSQQLLEAHISVLFKGEKDRELVSSYRPISLLNVEVKWYAKALANRLMNILPKIILLDQVGLIPGERSMG